MAQSTRVTAILVAFAAATSGLAGASYASQEQPTTVSTTPSPTTPHAVDDHVVANAAVRTFTQVGSVMYAGGRFHSVQDPKGRTTFVRDNLFSFDTTTGAPSRWVPRVNGEVFRTLHIDGFLYVGGSFTAADGVSGRLVRYRLGAGRPVIDPSWTAQRVTGRVTDLDHVAGRLVVAGAFRRRLVALDPATGKDTGYIDLSIAGTVKVNGVGPTEVYRVAVSPDGRRLVGIGNFATVAGQTRPRAFMAVLGPTAATLAAWHYRPLVNRCASTALGAQLRDVDFSPDGSYFVIVATGYVPATSDGIGRDICDAAARFETSVPNPTRPTWINYTGGDTLHSVAVTGAAVYVGGHQRWLDNPFGRNHAGPGAVARPGVAAIHPTTGKALGWNPTKTRGVGTKFIHPTSTGVWFGSDGRRFAGLVRDSIAFTPIG
jgi:hypothetical protein